MSPGEGQPLGRYGGSTAEASDDADGEEDWRTPLEPRDTVDCLNLQELILLLIAQPLAAKDCDSSVELSSSTGLFNLYSFNGCHRPRTLCRELCLQHQMKRFSAWMGPGGHLSY